MKVQKIINLSYFIFILIFISGCFPPPLASPEEDKRVKELVPPSDKSLVYIVRPAKLGKNRMPVTCNGKYFGTLKGKLFIYAIMEPGTYLFVSQAENESELPIVLEAGKTYFLEQQIKMGLFSARANLVRLNDEEGRQKLNKCKLVLDNKSSFQK